MVKRIIFAGTSPFGIPCLKALAADRDHQPVCVISQPDRPKGRNLRNSPSPISETALELGLTLLRPENTADPDFLAELRSLAPDLIITASYGEMLGKELREIPTHGAINIHPSLLPLYRGASPLQATLRSGDKVSGITIFVMTAKLDAGPILIQREYDVYPEDDFGTLHDRYAELSAQLLHDLLEMMNRDMPVAIKQDHAKATYTAKIGKEDQLIDWSQPAEKVRNLIRSLAPNPGAYQYFREAPLRFLKAEPDPEPANDRPGTIGKLIRNVGFTVNTGDTQLLIKTVQPAGKKIMDSWAFSLGSRITPGTMLGK